VSAVLVVLIALVFGAWWRLYYYGRRHRGGTSGLDRQDALVLAVLPTLAAAYVAVVVSKPEYAAIASVLFLVGFAASILAYRFLPKSAKERAKEEAETRAEENQIIWGMVLSKQAEQLGIDLRKKGIQTADDIAEQILAEDRELRPQELIDFTPLPHFKGYILPPIVERLPDLPDGQHQAKMTVAEPSSPDRGRLAKSQVIDAYWNINPDDLSSIKELIAKFGVIRVTAREKQMTDISAELKVVMVKDIIHPNPMSYNIMNFGYLNWFSIDLKNKILQDQSVLSDIDKNRGMGLNKYLLNPKETIHKDESKDLLIFYMVKDIPAVFLCAGSTTSNLGIPQEGKPVEFQFEISITADDFPKTTWSFKASAEWDDFKVEAL
jgi:hypothetical protein